VSAELLASIETGLQASPVCPHCGHRHDDAWEWNFGAGLEGDSTDRYCDSCGGMFDCSREVTVYYTTRAAQGQKPG
jgi:hypothetical protein